MRLFTVGPVEMYSSTLEIASRQLPYFRTSEFSDMMLDSERLIKKHTHAPKDSRVVFLTASGTAAMEAAVINCFDESDNLLIVNGGSFGKRFEDICAVHGLRYTSVRLGFGERLTGERMSEYDRKGYTGLLVNIHETSTGQLYDLDMLSRFCRSNGMRLVVDAISSFLADPLDFEGSGADVLILSSQKVLALSPGISILIISPRMLDRMMEIDPGSYYLDLKSYMHDMERGQTPFTPAVGILLELNSMLHIVDGITVEKKIESVAALSSDFRGRLCEIGVRIPDYPLSNALTPMMFDGNAMSIFEELKDRHGLMVTPTGGDLKGILLRVGHIGNLTSDDNIMLIEGLKEVLK